VVWGGVPKALLDGVIEPVCKRAVPMIPSEWPPQLAGMAARLAARDLGGALKALEKAHEDIATDTRERASRAIAAHIEAWIALAKAEIEAGHADTALTLLTDLVARTKGTEPGTAAKALLDEWKADAALKQELKGCKQCAQAVALELKWQYAAAQAVYRKVAKGFPDTKVGARAAAAADYIEQYGLSTLRPNCDDCRERRTPCDAHGG